MRRAHLLLLSPLALLAACGGNSEADPASTTGTAAAATSSDETLNLGADGVPRFREGLWEVTRIDDGDREVTKHCAGAEVREDIRQMLTRETPNCRTERSGGPLGIKIRSICDQGGVKTETELTMSGSSTRWNMKLDLHVVTPDGARDGGAVVMNARWIGACPAGLKPGDDLEE